MSEITTHVLDISRGRPAVGFQDATAIAGIAQTAFSKHLEPTEAELACTVIVDACADAGIDPSEIDKNVKTAVPVWGDCKETLPLLTGKIQKKTYPDWLQRFKDLYQQEFDAVIKDELNPAEGELTMGEVIRELNALTGGDAGRWAG